MRNFVAGCIALFTLAGAAVGETKGPPKNISVDLGGGVKMEMVLIPAGEFQMGSGESAEELREVYPKAGNTYITRRDEFINERPRHRVRINRAFYLGTYHVTRGQFRQFVNQSGFKTDAEKGDRPGATGWDTEKKSFSYNAKFSWRNAGFPQTDGHPVVNVSWNDAAAFCLSQQKGRQYLSATE